MRVSRAYLPMFSREVQLKLRGLAKLHWRPWEVLYPCGWWLKWFSNLQHVGLVLTSTRTRRWWWAATVSAKRLHILRSTSRTATAAYPCSGGQKKAGTLWASAVIFSPTSLRIRNRTEEKVTTEFRQQQKCCFQLWKEMWSHKLAEVGRSKVHFSNLNRWGNDNDPPSLAALGSPGPFHQEETLSRTLLLLRELPSICICKVETQVNTGKTPKQLEVRDTC